MLQLLTSQVFILIHQISQYNRNNIKIFINDDRFKGRLTQILLQIFLYKQIILIFIFLKYNMQNI